MTQKESQADFSLGGSNRRSNDDGNEDLKEIRSRAHAIIQFTVIMEGAKLSAEERDREMSRVRAHCKALSEAARRFLRDHQPEWYKLDQPGRDQAVRNAFRR